MIKKLKQYFERHLEPKDSDSEEERLKTYELAGAALMVELIQSDHDLDARETEEFLAVLEETFQLDPHELEEIRQLATEEARQATSLYEFTRLVNDNFPYSDKVKLVENLWRLAFADEKLDKYEESLIRRITDLIHVRHSDFIKAKHKARGRP